MVEYIKSLKDPKKLFNTAFLLLVVIVMPVWLFSISGSDRFENLVRQIGPWGPIVVIVYIIISHVFAPVVGSPVAVLSFTMYGVPNTMLYMYIGGLISSVINYWLAHVYGRKFVIKFAGPKTMEQIDYYAAHMGKRVLILARLIAGSLFDVVSYAAGITAMPFREYYLITIICSGISSFVTGYIFKDFDFTSPITVIEWVLALFILAGIFGYMFKLLLPYLKDKKISQEKLEDNDLLG